MKLKIDRNSIKFKSWLYFVLFAALLMAALWIVQVLFLNNFYGVMKTAQTKGVVKEIESSFNHHKHSDFLTDVAAISESYDMYIYVVSYDGKTTYFSPSDTTVARTPGFEVDENPGRTGEMLFSSQIQKLNKRMIQTGEAASLKIMTSAGQEILAYGNVLTSKRNDPLIVYIFSPLWPITSTVKILVNQLLVVTIISLVLACLISFYFSTRITRPIRRITYSAERLAEGDYGIVFRGGDYTEINRLADTLTGASIELEKSDMMQKDLIANVSHDLRTPLTMIRSYAEMIRDLSGENPEKRDKHLKVIIDESDRLNALVEDLLTVSRMQSGKMTLEKKEFNLTECIRSVLNTYRVMEDSDEYTFEFDCPSSFIVNADEDKIKQVVSNLVANAIKFCGDDKLITISLDRRGKNVICRVSDHGAGIPAEELEHIWERYYSSSSNTVREAEGTGLGLAICKEILSLHKSSFGVESTLGEGSTFWFQLNLVRIEK